MEFRQLETFVAVVEAGGFSRGAELLYLTQPTVTSHVSGLEQELGCQLLIRSTKGVRLTEAGQRVYHYAKSALRERQELLHALQEGSQVNLRIAASSVPAQCLLPPLLAEFRGLRPEVTFAIALCDSAEVGLKLNAGQAELGFCGSPQADCLCRPLTEDALCVITPNTERFRQLQGVFPTAWLLREPLVSREEGSGTRAEFQRWLAQHGGGSPHIVAELADSLAVKNAVAAGLGLAVYSRQAAAEDTASGRLLCFPLADGPLRHLYIACPREARLSSQATEFYHFVLERFSAEADALQQ